jgi:hypothetical protein
VPTRYFFAPLRRTEIDIERPIEECFTQKPDEEPQQEPSSKPGRPPPIVLNSTTTNLIKLQKQFKGFYGGCFEFSNTRSGTRIVTKEMADFSAIQTFLGTSTLSYTFLPKSEKPIKAVIRHLPKTTPAEDISDGLVSLSFDVISVKQMTTTRRTPSEGTSTINLPLFLITLPRTAKSQEIFRLNNLCHISLKVETYKPQKGVTHCYDCQQFGQVWTKCKHSPQSCRPATPSFH